MKNYTCTYWKQHFISNQPIQVFALFLGQAVKEKMVKRITLEDKITRFIPLVEEKIIIDFLQKNLDRIEKK